MKQNYFRYFSFLVAAASLVLTSCAETEDMVQPRETCDTVATVQYVEGSGLELVLENGQVLVPSNVTMAAKGKENFTIDGFTVKAGQQIIIGYAGQTGKKVQVNCIVGLQATPAGS